MEAVLVTGALGNLGWKATELLAGRSEWSRVLACDLGTPDPHQADRLSAWPTVEFIQCDLSKWHDLRWRGRILEVDAVIHFAAQNPFPEASWQEVAVSMDMTNHITTALLASLKRQRLVYVSSNHVMGRYKESLFGKNDSAGRLTTDLEPGVGTVWHSGIKTIDSTGYAAVKLAGERTSRTVSDATNGRITAVNLRIGWCQPGENDPSTLSAAGSITIERKEGVTEDPALAETNRWFREMWLANDDFRQLMIRSLHAESTHWPGHFVTVNGMSRNRGMVWSLREGRDFLQYEPSDDVYRHLD